MLELLQMRHQLPGWDTEPLAVDSQPTLYPLCTLFTEGGGLGEEEVEGRGQDAQVQA